MATEYGMFVKVTSPATRGEYSERSIISEPEIELVTYSYEATPTNEMDSTTLEWFSDNYDTYTMENSPYDEVEPPIVPLDYLN